jgi:hypothetical protein
MGGFKDDKMSNGKTTQLIVRCVAYFGWGAKMCNEM